jgi:hypothetical protein
VGPWGMTGQKRGLASSAGQQIMPDPFPKMTYENIRVPAIPMLPLKGSIHVEWKRCNRPNCRCANSHLHGPYFYRRWREDGRLRRAYVPREDLASALLAVALRREVQHVVGSVQSAIRTIRGMERTP